jgi:hypothetical protein
LQQPPPLAKQDWRSAPHEVQTWFAQVPLQHSENDWQALPPALQRLPEVEELLEERVPVELVWPPTPVVLAAVVSHAPTPATVSLWWQAGASATTAPTTRRANPSCSTVRLAEAGLDVSSPPGVPTRSR